MTPSSYTLFVGVDIAAASASVSWQTLDSAPCPPFDIAQTKTGWRELQTKLRATGHLPENTLVVVEATGSYWMNLALYLHEAGFHMSVINPLQAHGFARALLKRGKTDAIDAQTLTQLAAVLQPTPGHRHRQFTKNCGSGSSSATPFWTCACKNPTGCTLWNSGRW